MSRHLWTAAVAAVGVSLAGCWSQTKTETTKIVPAPAPSPTPAPQPPPKEVFLTPPGDTTVYDGKTVKVMVKLQRRNFTGPVTLDFDNLPTGVSVIAAQRHLQVEGEEAGITLQALPDAPAVQGHQVVVRAEGPDGLRSEGRFRLNVMK